MSWVKNKIKYCRFGHEIFVSHCKFRHRMATDKEIKKALGNNIGFRLYYKVNTRWNFVISDTSKRRLQHLAKLYERIGFNIKTKIKEVNLIK